MPKISQRTKNLIASPIRKFLPLILAAEKRGIRVIKINVGDPDLPTPKKILDQIKKYKAKNLGYAPSPGITSHVEAWIKYYKNFSIKLKKQNIIPTVGGAEAILIAFLAVADVGDEIIVFEPIYTSYKGFAAIAGVKLIPVTLKIENGFCLPEVKEIEKKITRKTKAIVIINPDNPTGKVWQRQELQNIIKIAKKHNLFIIADETYREIVFDGKKPSSLLKFQSAKKFTVVIDSTSKKFSCPGARIGVIVSFNQEIMQAALKIAMTRLSAPTLEQLALVPLLAKSDAYTNKIRVEYEKRRNVVCAELKKIPQAIYSQPQGAFYILVKLPIKNSENLVKFFLTKFNDNKETVMVTPAQDFYVSKNKGLNEIRIAYVVNTARLKRAVLILKKGLEDFKKI